MSGATHLTVPLHLSPRERTGLACRPRTSPSSWTATAAGPSSGICRASRAIARARNRRASIIRTAGELGIKYLTLYAFSVENWNRPKDEVDALMKYLVHYLKSETPELNKNNVRLEVIGQIYRLPENVQEQLKKIHRHAFQKQRPDA